MYIIAPYIYQMGQSVRGRYKLHRPHGVMPGVLLVNRMTIIAVFVIYDVFCHFLVAVQFIEDRAAKVAMQSSYPASCPRGSQSFNGKINELT